MANKPHSYRIRLACLVAALLWPLMLTAQQSLQAPAITIIIDDMGNRADWGEQVLALPGDVTYAFLPHTPHARAQAERAHELGKEVMLHLPMQSHRSNLLGPGALTLHMTEASMKQALDSSLKAIPHAKGVNNHMGSLLTIHPGAMKWLMEGLQQKNNLYFIDSRTSVQTVAQQVAQEHGIPNAKRDVFLDNLREPEMIRAQFRQLIRQAKRDGYAIGIGHPYPETAQVLAEELRHLESEGITLIPASEMVAFQGSQNPWHLSSSHSPKAAKSSKP